MIELNLGCTVTQSTLSLQMSARTSRKAEGISQDSMISIPNMEDESEIRKEQHFQERRQLVDVINKQAKEIESIKKEILSMRKKSSQANL